MRRTLLPTTLVVLLAATACAGADPDDTPAPREAATVQPTEPLPFRLVGLVGRHRDDALDLLRELGVRTRVESRPGCAGDVVVAQDPGPRQVTRRQRVTLAVEDGAAAGGCDLRPARSQARTLVRWARHGGPPPSFSDDLALLVGTQTYQRGLDAPSDRSAWELCEHGEGCQSALTVLADMVRPTVVRVLRGPCPESYGLLEPELAATLGRSVSVVDRGAAPGCRGFAAVQVWVDGRGDLQAVRWVL